MNYSKNGVIAMTSKYSFAKTKRNCPIFRFGQFFYATLL